MEDKIVFKNSQFVTICFLYIFDPLLGIIALTLSIQSQIYQKMNGKGFDQVNFDEISLTMHRIPGWRRESNGMKLE